MDELRAYLHLREWGELRYLLDLPWAFWVAVGVMLVGLVGLSWPQR
jgi:gamma-glutamylcysteine synthetase